MFCHHNSVHAKESISFAGVFLASIFSTGPCGYTPCKYWTYLIPVPATMWTPVSWEIRSKWSMLRPRPWLVTSAMVPPPIAWKTSPILLFAGFVLLAYSRKGRELRIKKVIHLVLLHFFHDPIKRFLVQDCQVRLARVPGSAPENQILEEEVVTLRNTSHVAPTLYFVLELINVSIKTPVFV